MAATEKPREFAGIGIDEKLGANLDLTVPVRNEAGEMVPLSQYFVGNKPVILSLVYYSCPGLCNFHLNGLTDALKVLGWPVGEKFQLISLSFDPKEGAEMARQKKASYLQQLGQPEAEKGWHFLTAEAPIIAQLTKQVGFQYRWDEANKDWAHASAAIVLTPAGKVSRYLHGILFEPRDLKLALLEASSGQIGSVTERLIFYCYHYDAQKSQYAIVASRIMQLGGGLMVLVMAAVLVPFWWRSRKESQV